MCWESTKLEPKISKGEVVYKRLEPKGPFWACAILYVHVYWWRLSNKKVKLEPYTYTSYGTVYHSIAAGYHSYRRLPFDFYFGDNPNSTFYEMYIPEGALYYENEDTEEIVSSEIKLMYRLINKKELTWWEKLGIKLGFFKQKY